MRLLFFLILSIVFYNAEAQFFRPDRLGIREDMGLNGFNNEGELMLMFTTSLTYRSSNWLFCVGPTLSYRPVKITRDPWTSDLENRLRISGITLGVKYYIKHYPKTNVYYFFDNSVIWYRGYEHFYEGSGTRNPSGLMIFLDQRYPSTTVVLQPILGSGIEIKFLDKMRFALDFGVGVTYRKINYRDNWFNYPTQRISYTGQVKFSLAYVIESDEE